MVCLKRLFSECVHTLCCHLGGATPCIKFTLHNYRQFCKIFICNLCCLHTMYFFFQLRMFVTALCCSYLNGAKDLFLQYHGKSLYTRDRSDRWFKTLFLSFASRPTTIRYCLFAREKNIPAEKQPAGTVHICPRCKVQQFSSKC